MGNSTNSKASEKPRFPPASPTSRPSVHPSDPVPLSNGNLKLELQTIALSETECQGHADSNSLDRLPPDLLRLIYNMCRPFARKVLSIVSKSFLRILSGWLVSMVANDDYPNRALSLFLARTVALYSGSCVLQRVHHSCWNGLDVPGSLSIYVSTRQFMSGIPYSDVYSMIIQRDAIGAMQEDGDSVLKFLYYFLRLPFQNLKCLMFDSLVFTGGACSPLERLSLDTVHLRLIPCKDLGHPRSLIPPELDATTLCLTLDALDYDLVVPRNVKRLMVQFILWKCLLMSKASSHTILTSHSLALEHV
jgi:hypothetical protein